MSETARSAPPDAAAPDPGEILKNAPAPEPAAEASGRDAIARGLIEDGPFERCIEPLLQAAGWRGDVRQIIEALPHLEQLQSVNDVRLVLHRLGFRSTVDLLHVDEIIDERLPALWIEHGVPMVVLATRADGRLLVFDSALGKERELTPSARRTRLCRVYSLLDGESADDLSEQGGWLRGAIYRMRREAILAGFLTFGANLLALTTPLYTMAVYNAILPAEGVETMVYLIALALAALAFETFLRRTRSNVLASASARLNCAVMNKSFDRILFLPTAMVENASAAAQAARVKQFESIVGAFSGPVLGAMFDFPFVVVFLLAIAIIGGPLVFAPIAAIVLFVLLGVALAPASESAARRAALLKDRVGALTHEMLTSVDSIHDLGAASVWRRRIGEAHRRAVSARIRASLLDYLRSSGSLFFIVLCTILTVSFGALMVMDAALSVGALVAVTMLASRVLAPVQTLFMAVQQISSSRDAARRFEALLKLRANQLAEKAPAAFRPFKGGIRFREVAFRFQNSDEFALRGVSAEIQPGEIIGLVGPGGSGKSTILKLLLGLYRPASGQILIDDANMAQIHLAELRAAVAYAPSDPEFFYGTIAQSMRLGRPTASLDEIEAVFDELGIVLDPVQFPEGMQSRFSAADYQQLSAGLRQKLSLARTFVKAAPITLLDEPTMMLDEKDRHALFRSIARRRGEGTVLITFSEMSTIQYCDRVMALVGGRLAKFDKPEALIGGGAPTPAAAPR